MHLSISTERRPMRTDCTGPDPYSERMRHFLHNHQHEHIFSTFNQHHGGQVVTDMYSTKPVGEWRSTLASLDLPRYEVSPSHHGEDAGDLHHWMCPEYDVHTAPHL